MRTGARDVVGGGWIGRRKEAAAPARPLTPFLRRLRFHSLAMSLCVHFRSSEMITSPSRSLPITVFDFCNLEGERRCGERRMGPRDQRQALCTPAQAYGRAGEKEQVLLPDGGGGRPEGEEAGRAAATSGKQAGQAGRGEIPLDMFVCCRFCCQLVGCSCIQRLLSAVFTATQVLCVAITRCLRVILLQSAKPGAVYFCFLNGSTSESTLFAPSFVSESSVSIGRHFSTSISALMSITLSRQFPHRHDFSTTTTVLTIASSLTVTINNDVSPCRPHHQVKDVLLPEAQAEYANVLEDTRHPAHKEAFKPEDLRRARNEAKAEVQRYVGPVRWY